MDIFYENTVFINCTHLDAENALLSKTMYVQREEDLQNVRSRCYKVKILCLVCCSLASALSSTAAVVGAVHTYRNHTNIVRKKVKKGHDQSLGPLLIAFYPLMLDITNGLHTNNDCQ